MTESLKNSSESAQTESTSGYGRLGEEVPFAPIPEDLKNVPERIARVCLAERKIMNSPEQKDKCAFNLFAANEAFRDPTVLNRKSPGFKATIDAPGFWQTDRSMLQDYGIESQFNNTVALSESMRAKERELGIQPTIYILSGISAAGKTTACKNADYPGMRYEERPDGKKGDPIGPLATDNSKKYLYMAGGSCGQIHAESSMMARKLDKKWAKYVSEHNGDCSEVRDKTFSEIGDVRGVMKNAQETGRRICDLDIDVPFIVSAVGVMMRPKGSQEPHPDFVYMKDNYALMKMTRLKKIGNLYPNSELDIDYTLKCYDYESNPKERQKEVARYEKGPDGKKRLVVLDQKLYSQSVVRRKNVKSCFEEADFVGGQLLTQEFIDDYCNKYINPEDTGYIEAVRNALGVYIDEEHPRTVGDILDDNAKA